MLVFYLHVIIFFILRVVVMSKRVFFFCLKASCEAAKVNRCGSPRFSYFGQNNDC